MNAASIQNPTLHGFVWKQGRWLGKWKKRYFIMKGETLYYFQADKLLQPMREALGSFNLGIWRFEIHTKQLRPFPFVFRMADSTSKISFLLAANSEAEMKSWISATTDAYYNTKYIACLPQIIRCQAFARSRRIKIVWRQLRSCVVKFQSLYRMNVERNRYLEIRKQLVKVQASARRWRARRDFKAIVRRKYIAGELLSTERIYVANLLTIIEVYLKPLLLSSTSPNPILSNQEVLQIFGNVEQLYQINTQLLQALTSRHECWNRTTKLGDVFCEYTDKLMMVYVPYILQYSEAIECATKCKKKSPQFKEFVEIAYADPRSKGLDLTSYLIQPVQRLPRYELLFRDLIKFTDDQHVDYSDLCRGMQLIVKVTIHINEKRREKDSVTNLVDLKNKLAGSLTSYLEWNNYHRLIREGEATSAVDKKISYMFLVNDFLLLAQRQKGGYRLRGIVMLKEAAVAVELEHDSERDIEKMTILLPNNEQIVISTPIASKPWSTEVLNVVEQIQSRHIVVTRETPISPLILSPKKKLARMMSFVAKQ